MNGFKFIKSKQQNWASRKGFKLVGSTPDHPEKNYLSGLTNNLFEPLSNDHLDYYDSGDRKETKDKDRSVKMKALYSSSAMVLNLFQYWQKKDLYPIVRACGLWLKARNNFINEIKFEGVFEISEDKSLFPRSPVIDVVIKDSQSHVYAIEAKFIEPYKRGSKPDGIRQPYIDNESFWHGLSNLYELAKKICPDNNKFHYLDAAQLIKHILGLKREYNKSDIRLLYLWYDVIGQDGVKHRKEIKQFAKIAQKDNIKFYHITCQEVIMKLTQEFYTGNEEYCNYLTDRYL
jgi:hypothetical protein